MLSRLQARLQGWATGRNVGILLGLFLLFEAVILPVAGARIQSYSGGPGPLDLTMGLSPADTYARLTAYTGDGRAFYLLIELTADILFPITYGLFFSLALALIFQRAFPAGSGMQRLMLVPLVGMLVDLVENAGIVLMLLVYPQELGAVAVLVRLLTATKWLITGVSVVLVMVGIVALVLQRRSASRTAG